MSLQLASELGGVSLVGSEAPRTLRHFGTGLCFPASRCSVRGTANEGLRGGPIIGTLRSLTTQEIYQPTMSTIDHAQIDTTTGGAAPQPPLGGSNPAQAALTPVAQQHLG